MGEALSRGLVSIRVRPTGNIHAPTEVEVRTADGVPIQNITFLALTVAARRQEPVAVVLEVELDGIDVEAHPLLGRETVRRAAEAFGWTVTE